ncbi:glutathione S-transferase family protein [Caulobacter sp. KR2-114]|uniref:glutathione S-transferase family protein n=1 Tax=Caulobacter sp. KR2-114 TaxID=3400912 RepID=UPI003C0994BE
MPETPTEIVIHGVPGSPYVRKVLLTCEEKGAPHRLAAMAIGAGKTPEHLAGQPFGRIPWVEHGDFGLYETDAVIRYVDEAFDGPPLQPKDPKARARMNQVMGIVDAYVMPSMTAGIGWARIMCPRLGLPVDEAAVAAAVAPSQTCLAALEAILGDQTFMAGPSLSLADLMLLPHIDFLPQSPEGRDLLAAAPRLAAWLERMRARPSAQATEADKLMAQAAAAAA